jgi:thioredoxin reductase (NADPH)
MVTPKNGESTMKHDTDLIILGAGPAGLTAAQYGARANLHTLVIEEALPGGQALLIDALENYPGNAERPDGTVKSGFEIMEDMRRQAENFGAHFMTAAARSLQKTEDGFAIALESGETLHARTVIIATGAKHRPLGIPGEDAFTGRGVSYCAACDGPFFKGKRIFVAGGGDAACDEAAYLARLSPHIVLVHRRDRFRAQEALVERVLRNPNIEVRLNTRIQEIRGEQRVGSVVLEDTLTKEPHEEAADAVFVCAGSIPQSAMFDVEKDPAGYIITDQRMACSVPGLFAAGDVRASPFRQVVVAAGEGAVAAHCSAAALMTCGRR